MLLAQCVQFRLPAHHRGAGIGPFLGTQLLFAQQPHAVLELPLGHGEGPSLGGAPAPDRIGFLIEFGLNTGDAGQARSGGEQRLAQIVIGLHHRLAAAPEPRLIEAMPRAEAFAGQAMQHRLERPFVDRLLVGIDQALLAALAAAAGEALSVFFQNGADPHQRIIEPEIIDAALGDAEQQVGDCCQGRRLAGFVGAVDDVKIGRSVA